jgi:predicted  nucleic acid-binding Zn-ribbon protein
MVSDADKAKQTTYTTDDIMAAILDLRKSNDAIKESNKSSQDSVATLEESNKSIQDSIAALEESNKSIQDSVAALEIRVKALELKPGSQADLFPPPRDVAPSTSQLPPS